MERIYENERNNNIIQSENDNLQDYTDFSDDDLQNKKLPILTNHKESKSTNNEEKQCTICCYNEDDITLNNCGHKICTICYKKMLTNKCPFCRSKITSYNVKKKISCGKRICSMLCFSKAKSE